jgi:hypothetical protein
VVFAEIRTYGDIIETSIPPLFKDRKMPPAFNQTPDQPESFGYKVSWFALRTSDPVSVLDALELGAGTPANWSSGLAAVYERSQDDDRWIFVSPPVGGWVLAVSSSWPYPTIETHR